MFYSESVENILKRSGWSSDRYIDPSPYRVFLESRGLLYNDKVEEFVTNFGGLEIDFVKKNGMNDKIIFDILRFPKVSRIVLSDDDVILNTGLSFIGSYSDGYYIILMDKLGNIHSSNDEKLLILGSDALEAISRIIYNKPIRVIFRPDDD